MVSQHIVGAQAHTGKDLGQIKAGDIGQSERQNLCVLIFLYKARLPGSNNHHINTSWVITTHTSQKR